MNRVIIVSNRLPISVARREGELRVTPSPGGLASGLRDVHEQSRGLWIGWPGHAEALSQQDEATLARQYEELRVVPVALDAAEVSAYYEDFCNGVLWPLFHYLLGQLPLEVQGLELYERVNRRFADAIVAHHRPGDVIWVHDYQLMLVPQLVRERLPDARIGFFLHIPFPSSEIFRTLPFRNRLLEGLLGADLVGFHTDAYLRHFASSVLRALGVGTDHDGVRWGGRLVRLGVFPMGVDARGFSELADSPDVRAAVRSLRGEAGEKLLVGIDRLDYTKGIARRLMAFEHLLRDHPELAERVRLVQVAVPSRTNVDAYEEFRNQVDVMVGRIQGQFATPSWAPVHYMYRGLPRADVVALYRAADVLLVTPIRDGMNLVAKEFVASRNDEDGVLVLSEFAGAAAELGEALHVNPYDVTGMAEAMHRALAMPAPERRTRMTALRRRVMSYDVHHWAKTFLERLGREAPRARSLSRPSAPELLARAIDRMQGAASLALFLDYDGTLVELADAPELAAPDADLLDLLRALAARPRTDVHVVSGRTRESLQRYLGALPITLHAEHGLWTRRPGQPGRLNVDVGPMPWREAVEQLFRDYAERTPGAFVEAKPVGLAWHYRMADPEYGPFQASELRLQLTELFSNQPLEILPGHKVIEVRAHGVHKGRIAKDALAEAPPGALAFAAGDDRTDEDLFAALPDEAITVRVGRGDSRASLRVGGVADVRGLLRALV